MEHARSARLPSRLAGALSGSFLLCILAAAPSGADGPGVSPRRVIILSGTEVMLPASQVEDGVIRQVLSSAGLGPIDFHSEGIDAFRFLSESYEQEYAAFLRRKYEKKSPDLVFALSDIALAFLTRHRDRLWQDSPVVFTSVDRAYFQSQGRPPWSTGILDQDSIAATIELARHLQPRARRILIVAGAGDRDRSFAAKVSRSLEPLRPGFEVVVRSGVPVSDFPREFGSLSADTILLYTKMFRDSEGRSVVPREAARELARAASVPVYGTHSTYLGNGIVGGALFDYEYEGRAAARMGVRILRGEGPSTIPILAGSPPLLAVDARQLERFGIPESRVPAGYEVRYRPPSFWQVYRWRIVAVAVALAAETALLIALLVERRQRRLAQSESHQRGRELAQAARLATVGELAASISHEINQPLGAIQANAEAAEMLLASANGQFEEVRQILGDIRRDDRRASEVVRRVRRLAGKHELEAKPVNVNELVDVVVRILRHEARQNGVTVEKDLDRSLPEACGDEVALQQVLINLALNGMEAMSGVPAERRRLVIRTRSSDGLVSVRVSDSGPGIAEADRPNLFASFFTTKPQGVGLGLAICRSILDAHGGSIDGANQDGGGAAFEFRLPAWTAADAAPLSSAPDTRTTA